MFEEIADVEFDKYNRGYLRISKQLLDDNPPLLAAIFAYLNILVVKAWTEWETDSVHYLALSPHFRSIRQQFETPIYTIIVSKNALNAVTSVAVEEYSGPGVSTPINSSDAESLRELRRLDV